MTLQKFGEMLKIPGTKEIGNTESCQITFSVVSVSFNNEGSVIFSVISFINIFQCDYSVVSV